MSVAREVGISEPRIVGGTGFDVQSPLGLPSILSLSGSSELRIRVTSSRLEVRSYIVRGLVEKGLLTIADGYRHGLSKLIPEKEVQRFAECYLPAAIVAKGLNLSACFFARYLRQSGMPLLAVRISDEGKGDAIFLQKEIASRLRIAPPRTSLRAGQ
jgi:hypothetical protein